MKETAQAEPNVRQPFVISAILLILVVIEVPLMVDLLLEQVGLSASLPVANSHHDFLAFYSAGLLLLREQASLLYDPSTLASIEHHFVTAPIGAAGYLPFLNPPFAAVFQAPLALLPEPAANSLWFGLNCVLAMTVSLQLTSGIGTRRRLLICTLMLGSFPFYQALAEGQWSLIMLLGCIASITFARDRRCNAVGLCLMPLWLKPQLALLAILVLLSCRYWRVATAMACGGLLLCCLTLPFTGLGPYLVYPRFLGAVLHDHINESQGIAGDTWAGALVTTEGLDGLIAGWRGLTSSGYLVILLAAGATGALWLWSIRKVRPGLDDRAGKRMLVATILLVLFLDPHLYPQDVTLLFLALPILTPHAGSSVGLSALVCGVADLPLVDQFWPVHLFTLLLWIPLILFCLATLSDSSWSTGASLVQAGDSEATFASRAES